MANLDSGSQGTRAEGTDMSEGTNGLLIRRSWVRIPEGPPLFHKRI